MTQRMPRVRSVVPFLSVFLTCLLLWLALSSIALGSPTPANAADPPPTITPTAAPPILPVEVGWETYVNAELGYAIKYPKGLELREAVSPALGQSSGVPSDLWFGEEIHLIARIPPLASQDFDRVWSNAELVERPGALRALKIERETGALGSGGSRISVEYLIRAEWADFFLVVTPIGDKLERHNRQAIAEAMLKSFVVLPQHTYMQPREVQTSQTDGFDFPVDPKDGSSGRPPWFTRYGVQNPYVEGTSRCWNKPLNQLQHSAEDWFRSAGSPVYAIANGRVVWSDRNANYPGGVIIVEHTLPSGVSNPWGSNMIYSMYAHLNTGSMISQWADVSRGQQIATVYDWGSNSHVHFEVRRYGDMHAAPSSVNGYSFCNTSWPGPGYTDTGSNPDWWGYTNPSAWIDGHRPGSGGSTNHAPNTPSLNRPSNWYVARDGRAPELCWNTSSDPDGDAVQYYAEVYESARLANSGWTSNTCWRPAELDGGYYGYKWQVKARDSHGAESGWSETWNFNIEAPNRPNPPALSSPGNGSVFNEGQGITLSWTATGSEYDAEFWGGPANTINSGWQGGTAWNIGPQWAGFTYSWHVKTRNSNGESDWSGVWTFTVKPAAPSSLSAQAVSASQINLAWNDNSGNEEGYIIYRNGGEIARVGAGATTYQNTGLSCETGYSYSVAAYRGGIQSDPSNTAQATTHSCYQPPDLRPHTLSGYFEPVVPKNVQSTHSPTTLWAEVPTFFDWHFINAGGVAHGAFYVELWVDNRRYTRYPYGDYCSGCAGGFDNWLETIDTPGWHTVKLIVDPDNTIAEADETNNVWESQFYWNPHTGWLSDYYPNADLSGIATLVRDDFSLDFLWGTDPPYPSLPADNFSVRWKRTLHFPAGTYRFHVGHDDGARLVIDGVVVRNEWATCCREDYVDAALNEGLHEIRLEYFDGAGAAFAYLWWEPLGVAGWRGEYYNNETLSGRPAVVLNEGNVLSHDWLGEAPHPLVQAEHFSARFTRSLNFASGVYNFQLFHDDGVRFYIDGALVFENWCSDCRVAEPVSYALSAGAHTLRVEMREVSGWAGIGLTWQGGAGGQAPADFDGDGQTDIGVWRSTGGQWWLLQSSRGFDYGQAMTRTWGQTGDTPIPADFDGDGQTDIGVWRPNGGQWWILQSSRGFDYGQALMRAWGQPGDIPVPADFDGDEQTDIGVWRPSAGQWWILQSSQGFSYGAAIMRTWGQSGDVPVPADYDGDGRADIGVWRPNGGQWWILQSSQGFSYSAAIMRTWGQNGDKPVVGDYDGDGQADIGVWRPSAGQWWILQSSQGFSYGAAIMRTWGQNGDTPLQGDFDGDGQTDLAVWRPGGGQWWILQSSQGFSYSGALTRTWGQAGDVPLDG